MQVPGPACQSRANHSLQVNKPLYVDNTNHHRIKCPKKAKPNHLFYVTDPVKKCLRALEAAETDTEKFATLFLVPKLVKGRDCDKQARLHLMKGIGYSFLARMLRSKDSPDGCPKLMFQSVALSVLSCFANEEEIMTHPSVSLSVPLFIVALMIHVILQLLMSSPKGSIQPSRLAGHHLRRRQRVVRRQLVDHHRRIPLHRSHRLL